MKLLINKIKTLLQIEDSFFEPFKLNEAGHEHEWSTLSLAVDKECDAQPWGELTYCKYCGFMPVSRLRVRQKYLIPLNDIQIVKRDCAIESVNALRRELYSRYLSDPEAAQFHLNVLDLQIKILAKLYPKKGFSPEDYYKDWIR
jgi:hypothetical protein